MPLGHRPRGIFRSLPSPPVMHRPFSTSPQTSGILGLSNFSILVCRSCRKSPVCPSNHYETRNLPLCSSPQYRHFDSNHSKRFLSDRLVVHEYIYHIADYRSRPRSWCCLRILSPQDHRSRTAPLNRNRYQANACRCERGSAARNG